MFRLNIGHDNNSIISSDDVTNVIAIAHRFRRDEGPRRGTGPPSVVRQPRQDCGSSMQLPPPNHPSHPASTDDRTRSHTGVQSDTVSTGLL